MQRDPHSDHEDLTKTADHDEQQFSEESQVSQQREWAQQERRRQIERFQQLGDGILNNSRPQDQLPRKEVQNEERIQSEYKFQFNKELGRWEPRDKVEKYSEYEQDPYFVNDSPNRQPLDTNLPQFQQRPNQEIQKSIKNSPLNFPQVQKLSNQSHFPVDREEPEILDKPKPSQIEGPRQASQGLIPYESSLSMGYHQYFQEQIRERQAVNEENQEESKEEQDDQPSQKKLIGQPK